MAKTGYERAFRETPHPPDPIKKGSAHPFFTIPIRLLNNYIIYTVLYPFWVLNGNSALPWLFTVINYFFLSLPYCSR